MLHNIEKRMLNLLLLSTIGLQLCTPQISSGKLLIASAGAENDNYRDWARFDPRKFKAPHRLVPAAAVIQANANFFSHGIPSFPHDPSRSNVIYGRGTGLLPTELYSKAFDILNIGGKYFQAPGAGERKNVVMDGQSITIYGTTCYTPLPNSRYVGNPAQVSPFDPTRVFYKDKDMWPSVIYGEPGQEILIANQRVRIPAAGQTHEVVFGKDGKLKSGGTDSGSSNQINDQPNKDSNSQTKNYDNAKAANSSAASGSHSLNTSGGNSGASGSSESGGNSGIKTATNKPAQSTADRAAADKAATDKAAADKAASEKAAADKAAADKAATDKAAADKAAADKAAADKAAADKAAADKAAADKAASDKAAADKAAADKAAADKAATDKAASDITLASTGSDTIGGSGSGSGSTGNSGFGSTGNSGSGSTGSSGSGSTGSSGSGSTGSSGSGSSTGSSGYGIGGTGATASTDAGSGNAGSGNAGDGGSGNVLAYNAESVAIPVTDKSTVKEDNGFFGWGAKQMFSIPIDKKKVCFYYDAGHTKEGEHDVVGTITGDISVLQQALAVDSATTADCELGVVAGPSAFVTARTLKIPTFRRIAEKSTAYPKLGPVIIAYKSNSSTLWTDSNTFVHNNPGLFAAPDSGVRYQNAGGAVGSAGGDSTVDSYTDQSSGTQLKSANEEAFDLSKFVLKIMGQ